MTRSEIFRSKMKQEKIKKEKSSLSLGNTAFEEKAKRLGIKIKEDKNIER